jgi:hypothetical protein
VDKIMNVWIRKFMRRKGSVKEGYDGRSLTEEGYFFGGRRKHLGRGRKFWFEGSFGFSGSEFEFCSRGGSLWGAPVCWGFWARGPG